MLAIRTVTATNRRLPLPITGNAGCFRRRQASVADLAGVQGTMGVSMAVDYHAMLDVAASAARFFRLRPALRSAGLTHRGGPTGQSKC